MRVPHFLCNSCMKTSPDTSNWWTVELSDGEVPVLALAPFVMSKGDSDKIGHACSRPCAARLVGQFLFTAAVDKSKRKKLKGISMFENIWFGGGLGSTGSSSEDDD